MNIEELHQEQKEVSAISLFKGELGTATAIRIEKEGTLKAHITKNPALLLCISGMVTYEDENAKHIILEKGDYITITPDVKHWLYASASSQLVLLK